MPCHPDRLRHPGLLLKLAIAAACACVPLGADTVAANAGTTEPASSWTDKLNPFSGRDAEPVDSMTMAERRLMDLVRREQEFFAHVENSAEIDNAEDFQVRAQRIVSDYEAFITDNPDMVEGLILYGKFLRKVGQDQRAFTLFERAHKLDGSIPVVKQQLGALYAENGMYAEALELTRQAVELDPDQAIYHYQLGELLYGYKDLVLDDGLLDKAAWDKLLLTAFSQAAKLDPDNVDFQLRYGETFYDIDNPDWNEALVLWTNIRQQSGTPLRTAAAKLHIARVLMHLGRTDEARATAESVTTQKLRESRDNLLETINTHTTR